MTTTTHNQNDNDLIRKIDIRTYSSTGPEVVIRLNRDIDHGISNNIITLRTEELENVERLLKEKTNEVEVK